VGLRCGILEISDVPIPRCVMLRTHVTLQYGEINQFAENESRKLKAMRIGSTGSSG